MTFEEKFKAVLAILKSTFYPNGKPLFSGPILINFGKREKDLATYIANELANAETALERARNSKDLTRLKAELRQAFRERESGDLVDNIQRQIEENERRFRERLKATGLPEKRLDELRDMARKFIVASLEENIPNAKVISVGRGFVKVGGQLIQIRQKHGESPVDNSVNTMIPEFSAMVSAGEPVPDLTIIGGMNPVYTRGEIDTAQGDIYDEQMTAPFIAELPPCVDADYLRKEIAEDDDDSGGSGLLKLIQSRDFVGGAMAMEWVDGFPREIFLGHPFLTNKEFWSSANKRQKIVSGKAEDTIYEFVECCGHRGYKWAAKIDANGRTVLFTETLYNFLLELDVPIHMMLLLGDQLTGMNFETWAQDPSDQLKPDDIRALLEALQEWGESNWGEAKREAIIKKLAGRSRALRILLPKIASWDPKTLQKRYEFLAKTLENNVIRQGIMRLDDQLQSWMNEVLPLQAELASRAIKRAREAGVKTVGNDTALVTVHGGNHFDHTGEIGLQFNEGRLLSIFLLNAIKLMHPEFKDSVNWEVVAPLYGRETKQEGIFGVVNPRVIKEHSSDQRTKALPYHLSPEAIRALPYHIASKHKGAKHGSRHADLVKVLRREDERRGRRRPLVGEGRYGIKHFGHSHYCFLTFAHNRMVDATGCHTFDDPFGEFHGNFRLTSVCSPINGYPAKGPAWGPITKVHFRYAELRHWVANPWPVNVKRLFPNAFE